MSRAFEHNLTSCRHTGRWGCQVLTAALVLPLPGPCPSRWPLQHGHRPSSLHRDSVMANGDRKGRNWPSLCSVAQGRRSPGRLRTPERPQSLRVAGRRPRGRRLRKLRSSSPSPPPSHALTLEQWLPASQTGLPGSGTQLPRRTAKTWAKRRLGAWEQSPLRSVPHPIKGTKS